MGRFEPNNENWIRISIKRGNIQQTKELLTDSYENRQVGSFTIK